MVDLVESEPFSTAEFRQQTQCGSKLIQSPIAGYADRSVNERIDDLALTEIRHEFRSSCWAGLREVCC